MNTQELADAIEKEAEGTDGGYPDGIYHAATMVREYKRTLQVRVLLGHEMLMTFRFSLEDTADGVYTMQLEQHNIGRLVREALGHGVRLEVTLS